MCVYVRVAGTGCAGTGKSRTLQAVRQKLRERFAPGQYKTAVTQCAMTGIAATIVDGTPQGL